LKSLDNFKDQFVLVVGDMMLDKYIIGTVERISPEAPVPVLRQSEVRRKLGGSGNVVLNAASLGAKVRAVGRIGDDNEGLFFRETIKRLGVDDHLLFVSGNTIVKTRVAAQNQQFIRIDEETITAPNESVKSEIKAQIDNILQDITVVIISEYAKGFVTDDIAQTFIKAAKAKDIPVFADPKGKSAAKYKGATAITPNNREFMDLTGLAAIPNDVTIKIQALRLCEENEWDYLILTRSEKGISIIDCVNAVKTDHPAIAKEVIDVTGAGDTVIATCAIAYGAGFSIDECARLANLAASIVVSKFGAAQTTIEELAAAQNHKSAELPTLDTLLWELKALREQSKRIVFTNGCFDLVHAGHISSFKQAREFGDVLMVAVNSDSSIRRIKGESRPVINLLNRVKLLAAIRYVDFVIPFEEDTPQLLIEQIKPDVLVKGKEWEGKEVAGAEFIKSYGGRVEFIELEQGLSSTNIIESIVNKRGADSANERTTNQVETALCQIP
jgi:D-beta-D-heptose 7-phosphate kinase/D-beta-D-heptose 1-phosphate adenosyltransferase